jgi:hypothetical protein
LRAPWGVPRCARPRNGDSLGPLRPPNGHKQQGRPAQGSRRTGSTHPPRQSVRDPSRCRSKIHVNGGVGANTRNSTICYPTSTPLGSPNAPTSHAHGHIFFLHGRVQKSECPSASLRVRVVREVGRVRMCASIAHFSPHVPADRFLKRAYFTRSSASCFPAWALSQRWFAAPPHVCAHASWRQDCAYVCVHWPLLTPRPRR